MAMVRHSVALLVVLAVVACFATAEACDCFAPVGEECEWDCYFQYEETRQQSVASAGIASDGDMATTALPPMGYTIVVGSTGKFKRIQDAIKSVSSTNTVRVIIYILNGIYKEKLLIPKGKSFIYFKCQSRKTVLTWGDTAGDAGGTALSASTAIEALGYIASDCTFVNSAPAPAGGAVGKQAVALRIQGDQGAFYRCGFYGAQDTLYDKAGRHYFRSCDMVGSIDWIFGDGQSFYQYCRLTSIAKGGSGSVSAQKRDTNSKTGFVFFQCSIGGTGQIYLGRAWGIYSRVIFYQCNIANVIRPEGYFDWGVAKRQKTIFYAEFQCTGPGANRAGRVRWSKLLTPTQALPFSSAARFCDASSWLAPAM